MGLILEVIGIVFIIVGIVCIIPTITISGTAMGIPTLVNGICLFAIGATYRTVKDIQKRIHRR